MSTNSSSCDELETYKNKGTPCKCKGGLYMSQSDSERSKLCRDYLNTEQGKIDMSNYECNYCEKGKKNKLFEYTSYIDDNWKHNCGYNINHNICKNI